MKNTTMKGIGLRTLAAVLLSVLVVTACGSEQDEMDEMGGMETSGSAERQEFAFTGTVEAIDTTTNIVSVHNEAIEGWMMSMTMRYYLEPAAVTEDLEVGDRITAKVYSGDFQHLYEVQVVPQQ